MKPFVHPLLKFARLEALFLTLGVVSALGQGNSDFSNIKQVAQTVPAPVFANKAESQPQPAAAEPAATPSSIPYATLNGVPIPGSEAPTPTPTPEPTPTPTPAATPQAKAAPEGHLPTSDRDFVASDAASITETIPLAENPPADALPNEPAPSQNATINLVNLLVKRGILSKEDAAGLIQQANSEAETARTQAQATQYAIEQASAAQVAAAQATAPPQTDGAIRVTYIPEVVKTQIREEVKRDVFAQAKEERWASAVKIPNWVSRIHPFGDIRIRFEGDFFPAGNDSTGAFPNFNAINTGQPFDVSGNQFSPQLNTDQDRYRFRLRARLGAEIDLPENFSLGFRVGTGQDNSPVTANQTLGLANQGQGGNFSKYAIWLDRAYIKWELGGLPNKNLAVLVGRFDNPFFTTSTVMWSNELGFDGIALQAKYEVLPGFTPFLNGGAFPIFNTDFNFSSNQPTKFKSYDKYLFAGQGGFDWRIINNLNLKVAGGYYYFYNAEGKLSSPFTPLSPNDAGDTDNSRPSFAQKGNTYMALRNIVANASNDYGTIDQYQYFGLATPFQVLGLNGKLEYKGFEPVVISLSGEFYKNLAFDKSAIDAIAVNNRGANDTTVSDSIGTFAGGDTAWIVQMQVGSAALEKRGDWQIAAGYRYVESDAVIDGFCDTDFGGGGTNLKGYTIGGSVALSPNIWVTLKWLSAQSIAGPPYKEDVIQFDLNGKF